MSRLCTLFWIVPFLWTASDCDSVEEQNHSESEPPWADVDFINPSLTNFTFVNGQSEDVSFSLRGWGLPEIQLQDSVLAPGEEFSVQLYLARPAQFNLAPNDGYVFRMLPGYERVVAYVDSNLVEEGPHAELYRYYDEASKPISILGTTPLPGNDVYEVYERYVEYIEEDSLPPPAASIPDWMGETINRERRLWAVEASLMARFYHLFFYADTLGIPSRFLDTIEVVLADEKNYHAAGYQSVVQRVGMIDGYKRPYPAAESRNYTAIFDYLIDDYPLPHYRDDHLAALLYAIEGRNRDFGQKDSVVAAARAALSPDYRVKVDERLSRLTDVGGDPAAMEVLMDHSFAQTEGGRKSMRSIHAGGLTLFKLYFAGCYPCLKVMPDERELMAQHLDLNLVYIAYATRKDEWKSYIDKYDPPADDHLWVDAEGETLIREAIGPFGAPTYLLLNGDEVECTHCPQPSELDRILGGL